MSNTQLRVALIARTPWDYPALYALATPGLEFGTFDTKRFATAEYPNPFGLPIFESADVALISSFWHSWLQKTHPDRVALIFRELERRVNTIVALDSEDAFSLLLPPNAIDRYALVIKAHGVYRDRDLYNYESGAPYPGDRWADKVRRIANPYSDTQLDKLRLGPSCLLNDVLGIRRSNRRHALAATNRRRARTGVSLSIKAVGDYAVRAAITNSPIPRRRFQVHCLGSATHAQRLEALRQLDGLSGVRGITGIPKQFRGLVHDSEVTDTHRAWLADAVAPFERPPTSRSRYYLDLCRHQIVVAPSGFGELTFRHGEAMRAGAALVCPSLEHVEIRFPFQSERNVVWCATDLSDLRPHVQELLADEARRSRIAATARRDLLTWERGWQSVLEAAISAPLREAVGVASA